MPNIKALEREHVARLHAKLDLLTRAHYPDPEKRTLVVGHRSYEVVWTGAVTRQEVVPAGVRVIPPRLCACGCGVPVTFRLRYASSTCAARGNKDLNSADRGSERTTTAHDRVAGED